MAEFVADTTIPNGLRWILLGKDAEWFYLDEKNIRLNSSAEKILDREVLTDDIPSLSQGQGDLELPYNQKTKNIT